MRNATGKLTLKFRGEKLDKKDFFGSSDPYLQIFRPTRAGGLVKIAETEVISGSLNPVWKPLALDLDALNRGDLDVPLLLEVWDRDNSKDDELIGAFEASTNDILKAAASKAVFSLVNPNLAAKKKGYTDSGKIIVGTCFQWCQG